MVYSSDRLRRYLSPLGVWALAFGSAVGWGAFVMPGTTFLPVAGPLGTALGIAIGALVMFVIGINYQSLMKRYPDAGGAYAYVKNLCNYDHGYLCGWFLIITYIAIVWGNATALAVICRELFGNVFAVGLHYRIAGYDVYLGEVALSAFALLAIGSVAIMAKRFAAKVQTFMAIVLFAGIAIVLCIACFHNGVSLSHLAPSFSSANGTAVPKQIIAIIALTPWAFVGFESISHSVEEFDFNRKKLVGLLSITIATSAFAYIALTGIAASTQPAGYANWTEHVANLSKCEGSERLPVFYAVESLMGKTGFVLLLLTTLAAIVTGIIGHLLAVSRLIYSLARDGLFPSWFAVLNKESSPKNVLMFLVAVSCFIPFVGRTAIGWIIDVTTIGACIAYGYVSYCALRVARNEKKYTLQFTGIIGIVASAAFMLYFLVPNFWAVDSFAEESYIILACWCILGFVCFRGIFARDKKQRLGKSTIVWLSLLFLIFFASHMWVRVATHRLTYAVVADIGEHYQEELDGDEDFKPHEDEKFLASKRQLIGDMLVRDNTIQMSLVVLALGIMFSIYSTMSRREHEASQAKEYFFSTVSHDIRTPLNAIIGYSQMLKLGFKTQEERQQALDSILISSETLLHLINDILDLSSLDLGQMKIESDFADCTKLVNEIVASFQVAAGQKKLELRAKIEAMPMLMIDAQRLRQIAFNLIGNALKFTEKGHVEVRAYLTQDGDDQTGTLHFEVEDTGVGICPEDQAKIFSPYVKVGGKLARNGGTGLGLAICKALIEAMGGRERLQSEPGKGTTFWLEFPNVKKGKMPAPAEVARAEAGANALASIADRKVRQNTRVLIVDDAKMNLMVLKALLKKLGTFDVETATDGKAAYERLCDKTKPKFDVVLTDMWMPEMDGAELVAAVRKNKDLALLPIYVVTADVELQKDFDAKGFDGLLLKPVTLELLKGQCDMLFEC